MSVTQAQRTCQDCPCDCQSGGERSFGLAVAGQEDAPGAQVARRAIMDFLSGKESSLNPPVLPSIRSASVEVATDRMVVKSADGFTPPVASPLAGVDWDFPQSAWHTAESRAFTHIRRRLLPNFRWCCWTFLPIPPRTAVFDPFCGSGTYEQFRWTYDTLIAVWSKTHAA